MPVHPEQGQANTNGPGPGVAEGAEQQQMAGGAGSVIGTVPGSSTHTENVQLHPPSTSAAQLLPTTASGSQPTALQQYHLQRQALQAPLPDPGTKPSEFLSALLRRIASLDKDGYFQIPVDEVLHRAPKYYSIIKQPMCFQEMHRRLESSQYGSWKAFRDDFELICNNARKYNGPKTKVNKAAAALQRFGTKLLKQHELDIRKAFSLLLPNGASAGAAAAAGPGLTMSTAGTAGTTGTAAFSAEKVALMQNGSHESIEPTASTPQDATTEATSEGPATEDQHRSPPASPPHNDPAEPVQTNSQQAPGHISQVLIKDLAGSAPVALGQVSLPSLPARPVCTYISEDEDEHAVASRKVSQAVDTSVTVDNVLKQARTGVVYQPWSSHAMGAPPPALLQTDSTGQQQQQQSVQDQYEPSNRTLEWKQERRPLELQARWVELRLRELNAQQQRLQQQLSSMRSAQQQPAAEPAASAMGATSASPAELAASKNALMQSVARLAGPAGSVAGALLFTLRSAPPSPASPMAVDSVQPTGSDKHVPPAQSGSSFALRAQPQRDDKQAPAALYTAFELLEQQLGELRSRLAETFPNALRAVDSGMAGPASSRGVFMMPVGFGHSAPVRQQSMRRTSTGRLRSASGALGLSVLTRVESAGGKRKRSEADLDGLASPTGLRGAERQASAIYIPPVRELPDMELTARKVAMTAWSEDYQAYGDSALQLPPPEVEAVLDGDEGSSSEDTSDEAYVARHALMEEEEHTRYQAVVAENQKKRANKTQANGKGKGQMGMKTPRAGATATVRLPSGNADDGFHAAPSPPGDIADAQGQHAAGAASNQLRPLHMNGPAVRSAATAAAMARLRQGLSGQPGELRKVDPRLRSAALAVARGGRGRGGRGRGRGGRIPLARPVGTAGPQHVVTEPLGLLAPAPAPAAAASSPSLAVHAVGVLQVGPGSAAAAAAASDSPTLLAPGTAVHASVTVPPLTVLPAAYGDEDVEVIDDDQ
mmetsp:Transcript_2334/g.5224  ORF Transcript_2334/g.5224 Transcript_2334/m.5224 type:complete len:995 (+) Transcript_2334:165-3149(+)